MKKLKLKKMKVPKPDKDGYITLPFGVADIGNEITLGDKDSYNQPFLELLKTKLYWNKKNKVLDKITGIDKQSGKKIIVHNLNK